MLYPTYNIYEHEAAQKPISENNIGAPSKRILTETSRPGKLSFFARNVVKRHFDGYNSM